MAEMANCARPPFFGAHEVHCRPLIAESELAANFIHVNHRLSAAFVCRDSRPRRGRIQALTAGGPATIAEWLTRPACYGGRRAVLSPCGWL
jgi:hypothetical protein